MGGGSACGPRTSAHSCRRLEQRGLGVTRVDDVEAHVEGSSTTEIGDLALAWGLPLHHLSDVEQSLEAAFLELTSDSVEFHGTAAEGPDEHPTTFFSAAALPRTTPRGPRDEHRDERRPRSCSAAPAAPSGPGCGP